MLDWLTIIILLVVGIGLLVTELIFIPGTTIFGIAGVVITLAGIVVTFISHGAGTGWAVTGIASVAAALILAISLRSRTWNRLSFKGTHTSRVNEDVQNNIWKGDVGKALSSLRPSGKAEFNDIVVEVSTRGQYISAGTRIRVVEVQDHRILVESAAT